jgi:spermidine synthase
LSLLHIVIFISGAAILALELLASRIMTPYFGVSLYIWTGILSITLISLALGYWAGGRFAGAARATAVERLVGFYALMPALAALAIVAACLAYPYVFSPLAGWSLIAGAFAACVVLLFVPLVATSAMNPLLVAIALRQTREHAGDAGAGRVFFVSTIGSVAGVLVTAFAMIPHLSNFAATLTVALTLAALSLAMALSSALRLRGRPAIVISAVLAALAAAVLLWNADAYTGRQGPFKYSGASWRVEASHGSLFGTVKILRTEKDAESGLFHRMYFHDGLVQNTVDSHGRSESFYTYALEALAYAYRPQPASALVLGLGAGMVPTQLARRGVPIVEVVEIDPISLRVARQYFGFDPARTRVHNVDARTFVQNCPRRFDVVIVDLFHGDGTPDYLVTREFFRGLRNCLAPDGVAVFNTFADLEHPIGYAHFLATLRTELPHLALYRPNWPGAVHVNSFVVAGAQEIAAPGKVTFDYVPPRHSAALWEMLARPRAVDATLLAGGRIVTDARNAAVHDVALGQLIYRQSVVGVLPAPLLLN